MSSCCDSPAGQGCDCDTAKPVSDGEVRVTSDTGGQKGKKLARFDLLPTEPLTEVARLYGKGAEKYADRNWELGYDWGLSFAAMQRHAWLFWGGESIDPETERHHLASVVFHALALMEYERLGKGTDSRSKPTELLTPEALSQMSAALGYVDHAVQSSCNVANCPVCST